MTLLLTIPEAAVELRCGRNKIYRLIARGRIKAIDTADEGSTQTVLRVPRSSLEAYIQAELGEAPAQTKKARPRARARTSASA